MKKPTQMWHYRRFVLFLLFLPLSLWAADPVEIEIRRTAGKYNLGVSPFVLENRNVTSTAARDLRDIVVADLTFSKLFNLVTEGPEVKKGKEALEWMKIGSDMVLAGAVRLRSNNDLDVSARLFDANSGKENVDFKKRGPLSSLRELAHDLSNEVVKYFTGQPGIFNSRIVFINDATGRKELHIMDYDGKNARRLTNDNSIVVLPRLSWDGKKIIFTSYLRGNPDLYLMNRDGSGRQKMSDKAGLNVSPSWAPSGEEFALTLSIQGPPSIYLMDMSGRVTRRLTDTDGADTAPSFSPDGSQLVFTSDRDGAPRIYVMNIDGTEIRRLTTLGHCDSPAWSPDGQTIVYVKNVGGDPYDIYSIEVQTGLERRLTWARGNSENPTWSPDGRFIVYTNNRSGKYELTVMTADGSDPHVLFSNNGQSFTPHWSN